MPWVTIDGERKKVACGPCIRGHRSSKCDHNDRVLLEVRKPGRPLSSCPHSSGSCNCQRVVINYTIPRASECPSSENAKSTATPTVASPTTVTSGNNRVQKPRHKKSNSVYSSTTLGKALKATEATETAATAGSVTISESSSGSGASPASSNSSTPRLSASHQNQGSETVLTTSNGQTKTEELDEQLDLGQIAVVGQRSIQSGGPLKVEQQKQRGSCCSSKQAAPPPAQPPPQPRAGGCCGGGKSEAIEPVSPPKKSCCSSAKPPAEANDAFTKAVQQSHSFYSSMPAFHQMPLGMGVPYIGSGGAFHPTNQAFPSVYGHPGHPGHLAGSMSASPLYGYNGAFVGAPILANPHQPTPAPVLPSVHIPTANTTPSGAIDHNCNCGDGCACLGCAAHPQNMTTVNYVRTMAQYMQQFPPEGPALSPYLHSPAMQYPYMMHPHPAGFMHAPAHNLAAFNGIQHPSTLVPPFFLDTNIAMHMPHSTNLAAYPLSAVSESNFSSTPATEKPSRESSIQQSVEPEQSQPAESPQVETPTLSPSSFFLQTLVLPGCSDATGTCQCGDGCECVGCLTHGGHDGIPLESTVTGQDDMDFNFLTSENTNPDLAASNEIHDNNPITATTTTEQLQRIAPTVASENGPS